LISHNPFGVTYENSVKRVAAKWHRPLTPCETDSANRIFIPGSVFAGCEKIISSAARVSTFGWSFAPSEADSYFLRPVITMRSGGS